MGDTGSQFTVGGEEGPLLSAERSGEGPSSLVGAHGLTAHRRLVLMGSRLLQRNGWEVTTYDARGHGRSGAPRSADGYGYADLAADLAMVIERGPRRPSLLAGVSMGAHTAVALALNRPELVRGLVLITPAFTPDLVPGEESMERWDSLADALESGGVEGFLDELDRWVPSGVLAGTARKAAEQRMAAHGDLQAVAQALRSVPRSSPFGSWAELERISVPTVVIASRDDFDPGHPFEVGRRWAEVIPGATLEVEAMGESPLAWRGARISEVIERVGESIDW